MMRAGARVLAVLGFSALWMGCALAPSKRTSTRPLTPPDTTATSLVSSGIVYCADGAGGFGWTTEALEHTVSAERLPLRVELVQWSHGRGRMILDNCDWSHLAYQSERLAKQIWARKQKVPGEKIYLLGHSAGCAVVLEAAGRLPPDSIERVILLAPSVSPDYDLRPALAASRSGVHAFTSRSDWVTLGITMRIFGTTDRRWTVAAGRVGFRQVGDSPRDLALYGRLREHVWEPAQAATGHRGGHYGSYEPEFLRKYVLPLMKSDAVALTSAVGPDR